MKLQKKSKTVADIKRVGEQHRQERLNTKLFAERRERRLKAAKASPLDAAQEGVGYTGPEMPDKGKYNGSCNRTACQVPLEGQLQYYMEDHMTGGRLYYCRRCEIEFTRWDRIDRPNQPLRCTPDEDNINRSTRKVAL